jgi:dihydroflavonol-4-reductase
VVPGFWASQRKTNVDGTGAVVEAALRRHAKRFIHTSSISAFGISDDVITEETPSNAEEMPYGYLQTMVGDSVSWLRAAGKLRTKA